MTASHTTVPAIFTVTATWYLLDADGDAGPRNETTMIMEPGQNMVADAPKIISVLLWATNKRADEVKVIALAVSDVQL